LNPDFVEMLSALCEERAEFLLVGALALAVHGRPRATGDMDLWIRPTRENAGRVIAALRRFGAPMDQVTEADLVRPDTVFQIGVQPRRIDILTGIDGVSFDEAWAGRLDREVEDHSGLRIPVIGRRELIRNKRSTGRTQDLADAEALEGKARG
jgi:hypothetical protein